MFGGDGSKIAGYKCPGLPATALFLVFDVLYFLSKLLIMRNSHDMCKIVLKIKTNSFE